MADELACIGSRLRLDGWVANAYRQTGQRSGEAVRACGSMNLLRAQVSSIDVTSTAFLGGRLSGNVRA